MEHKKSMGLNILWWGEIIISVRTLLFCVPVLISKLLEHNLYAYNIDDLFIIFLTTASLLYFILGVASVMGHGLWLKFHYLVLVLVVVMTAGLMRQVAVQSVGWHWVHFAPALFAIAFTVLASTLKR